MGNHDILQLNHLEGAEGSIVKKNPLAVINQGYYSQYQEKKVPEPQNTAFVPNSEFGLPLLHGSNILV